MQAQRARAALNAAHVLLQSFSLPPYLSCPHVINMQLECPEDMADISERLIAVGSPEKIKLAVGEDSAEEEEG